MKRVLIAEDDISTRELAGALIKELGHAPVFSPNGRHAWETLQVDEKIDLLITDVMMPEMDGKVLIKTLREDDRFCRIPVIVISGVVGPKEIASLLEMGATRFQAKPLNLRSLRENIEASLDSSEAVD